MINQNENNYLIHFGNKNSGRYPRGSGENPHQHDGKRVVKKVAIGAAVVGGLLGTAIIHNTVRNTKNFSSIAKAGKAVATITNKEKMAYKEITSNYKPIFKEITKKKHITPAEDYRRGLKILDMINPFVADMDLFKK